MEKGKIAEFINNAGTAAKSAIDKAKEKTISVIDQNEDGTFDMSDVSVVADAVGDAVKKGANTLKETAEESHRIAELKRLRPIFPSTLDETDFVLTKLIRVLDRDKKYVESEVCQGSIGYKSEKSGFHIINLFKDSIDKFGLTFYPDSDCEFYYVNPTDRDNYISLDDYFSYLKLVRINELQRVAMELGAKYFKVTYKEESTSFSDVSVKAQLKADKAANVDGKHDASEKKYSMINVAAENSMDGHEPKCPNLVYLAKDDSVNNLINLRMNGNLKSQKISIKMSNSSGIKESDAVKIDAALKGMKVSGNTTVSAEAKNESRRYLEYEISF